MAITIGELVELPLLKIRLHAGATGVDRLVAWAHSCELPNPWDWLGTGDLLMCNGLGIPADEEGQRAFVTNLDAAGMSGLLIGEDHYAPPLSPAMLATAEQLAFPVMLHPYEVPFVPVARAVADANAREEQARLVDTVRLYDLVRASALEGSRGAHLVERLGAALRARLFVLDPERGSDLMPGLSAAGRELRDALVRAVLERDGMVTSVIRRPLGDEEWLAVPVPSSQPAMLVVRPRDRRPPALALLQHVALIVALELEKLWADREVERRLGAELFAGIIDGRIDRAGALDRLQEHGFGSQPLVVAACRPAPDTERRIHHRLTERGIPRLLLRRGDVLLSLLPAASASLSGLLAELDGDAALGTSDTLHGLAHVADAVREARWGLRAAEGGDARVVRYGESAPLFLPRTISEAQAAVARVLGELIAYDEEQGTELLDSLTVFLECNRSWQGASRKLMLHKQTIVYRMRRVEELTGRSLNRTADVTELWLAIQAKRQIDARDAAR